MEKVNWILKNRTCSEVELIRIMLKNITDKYGVRVNLQDIAGIRKIDRIMDEIFMQYDYHNNSFCNYVKKNKTNFALCIEAKSRLCSASRSAKHPFYSKCYMGLEEIYYPMHYNGQLIGLICVGQFTRHFQKSIARIRLKAEKYGLNSDEFVEKYKSAVISTDAISISDLNEDVSVLSKYISLIYKSRILENSLTTHISNSIQSTVGYYQNKLIFSSALEFIKMNYSNELSLKLISRYCNCNATYLSYLFKKETGITITDYINKCRVDHAKHLLDTTDLTVVQISNEVGFNDSSYFSRVFKKTQGVYPKHYRDRK